MFLIMSAITATLTTPPVTVHVIQGISHHYVMMAPTSVGLATSSQCDVGLPPQLILRDTLRGSVDLITVS